MGRETHESRGLDVHAGSPLDVVNHHRQIHRIGDAGEVAVKTLLSGLVVVRSHLEAGGGTLTPGDFGHPDRFVGAVGTGARDNRDAAVSFPDHPFHHIHVLFMAHRGALAGGSHGNQSVHTVVNLKIHQSVQGLPVYRSVGPEGCYQCRQYA